ncbi:DUF2252 domain-containing protein [Streptomyces meridianus]|uniref:DUF2252 domain-containing protein n=1 Tax=Streptomyces meridianus TaxID=2938945 RepID=A0ABT0XBV8_9ACTN|nr:DUF2252 domain-containing protein [Streptomyces meridianus]MCM2580014.1 DUF2252 domain-containing protein [Streptomyces meridianus]
MDDETGLGPDRGVPPAGPGERAERGRAARKAAPRSAHADYAPAPGRPDPLDVIEEQSRARLPDLVPVRYGRMAESPFRFYRGAAAIMAQDLAGTPQSGLRAQLCGDAHMLNFRLLASPERRLVFDINDFDETLPGPWEWDVKRLAASLVIAARANGFDDLERSFIVRAAVRAYREGMRRLAGMGHLEVWYSSAEFGQLGHLLSSKLRKGERERLTRAAAKARRHDNLQAFGKLTAEVDGERRFVPDPPLLVRLEDLLPDVERNTLELGIRDLIDRYSRTLESDRRHLVAQYRVVDVARKVVGVGSVGTRCWIVLLLGRDGRDPLILQAKEADRSVLAPYAGESVHSNHGERVVCGQRLMQATSDIFLGRQRVHGIDGRQRDFYVRQLRDWKGIAQPDLMELDTMRAFGEVSGATLARAHARSGDRIAIAAYLGRSDRFDRALAEFAESYADQNERDHAALKEAVRTGRVAAETL